MKVLVTGGSGVIGQATVRELLARGYVVRLLSRHANEDVERWAARVEPWVADIGAEEQVEGSADGCDAVLHITGIATESPPESTFQRINVEGTRHIVAEAIRSQVKRFIYVSSLGAERGTSDYHRSKFAAEQIVARLGAG